MNKKQLIQVLQSCLFAFDGATKEEIKELNSDYNNKYIVVGVNLSNYLKEVNFNGK